jgi:hypothetical protein
MLSLYTCYDNCHNIANYHTFCEEKRETTLPARVQKTNAADEDPLVTIYQLQKLSQM